MPRSLRLSYARFVWLTSRQQRGETTQISSHVSNIDSGVQRAPQVILRAHNGIIGETASGRGGR